MKPLVSVIVPVYKVEKYLDRCLKSLCGQSLREIEVILIDDASPDRCGEICERYAVKDKRFKIIRHSENKGLSAARNTGINFATADYLMFVDSDDYVHEDFCRLPFEYAVNQQADLVLFNYSTVHFCFLTNMHINSSSTADIALKTQIEALDLLQGKVGHFAWNKLYRKDIFKNIIFPPGYLLEDWGTTYKTVLKSNKIFYLDKVLYYYCKRPDSIMSLKTEQVLKNSNTMMIQQYHDLAAWKGYPSSKLDNLLQNIALSYCIKKKKDLTDPDYVFYAEMLRSYKNTPSGFNRSRKLLFKLFKNNFPLFELVCFIWGKKCC